MNMSTVSASVWLIKDGKLIKTVHKDVPYQYLSVDENGVITADPATASQLLYSQGKATYCRAGDRGSYGGDNGICNIWRGW